MPLGKGLGVVCSRELLRLLDFSEKDKYVISLLSGI